MLTLQIIVLILMIVTLSKELNKFNCAKETAESSAVFTDDIKNDKLQELPKEYSSSMIDSSFKRKPGRPKKIGPQVVKQIKRPIGRPPKPKTDQNRHRHLPK